MHSRREELQIRVADVNNLAMSGEVSGYDETCTGGGPV